MSRRTKTTGRREAGTYFGFPHAVMDSQNYLKLTTKAVKLLNDIGRQYNGHNNGDLCATYSVMKKRGWVSKRTLESALKELMYYELITLTRQGGRNKCSLFAVTWQPIDECKGKLDVKPTRTSPGTWNHEKDL